MRHIYLFWWGIYTYPGYFCRWMWASRNTRALAVSLLTLDRKIERLRLDKIESDYESAFQLNEMAELAVKSERQYGKTKVALEGSLLVNKRLEETLEAVRDQLKTANEITIPGLVAAHDVMIKRWRDESMVYVMRGTIGSLPKDD